MLVGARNRKRASLAAKIPGNEKSIKMKKAAKAA
jgi:hypothetical protein